MARETRKNKVAIAARHLSTTVTHFAHVDLTPAAFSAAVLGTT